MTSLADQIIESNNNDEYVAPPFFGIKWDLPEFDDCGLPTSDSLDYFVARLIAYNYKFDTDGHLHMRNDGRVWKGNRWIKEDTDTLYRIARWNHKITSYQRELIWQRAREVLPHLSRDKFVITDNLVWNRVTGELEEVDTKPNTIF